MFVLCYQEKYEYTDLSMTEIITGRSHQFSSFLLFILTSLTILHHIIITIIINYIKHYL